MSISKNVIEVNRSSETFGIELQVDLNSIDSAVEGVRHRLQNIKVIFFDIGGVILTDGMSRFIEEMAQMLLVPSDVIKKLFNDGETARKLRMGKVSLDVLLYEIAVELRRDYHVKIFDFISPTDLIEQWFREYEIIQETQELMRTLSDIGYTIGLLSANFRERIDYLRKTLNFDKDVNPNMQFLSYDLGIDKRDPLIFDEVLRRANLQPEEAIFVDDGKEKFLVPAAKKGIIPVWFNQSQGATYDKSPVVASLLRKNL